MASRESQPPEATPSGPFSLKFGQIMEKGVNGSLDKVVPGFSENGMPPDEKNLYRAFLTFRLFTCAIVEFTNGGQLEFARLSAKLAENVIREYDEFFEALREKHKGEMPSEIMERLESIREIEV